MEWTQFLILLVTIAGLFFWNRSESRSDARNFDIKLETYRQETYEIIRAIQSEIKDFHGRLCAIEEKKNTKDK